MPFALLLHINYARKTITMQKYLQRLEMLEQAKPFFCRHPFRFWSVYCLKQYHMHIIFKQIHYQWKMVLQWKWKEHHLL